MNYHPRRTTTQWQQLVQEQQKSGLSQKAFCEMQDIRPATFGYWRRKLSAQETDNHAERESSWLDLSEILDGDDDSTRSWKIELDLGNGVVLRLNQQ